MTQRIGNIVVLTDDDVLKIHYHLVKYFIEHENDPIYPAGYRDKNLFLSTVGRQTSGIDGTLYHNDPLDNAVALMYGICNNHPFHNGNKRTALVCLLVHLFENNFILRNINHEDLYKLILSIARHDMADIYIKHAVNTSRGRRGSTRRNAIESRMRSRASKLTSKEEQEICTAYLRPYVERIDRHNHPITTTALISKLKKRGFIVEPSKGNQAKLYRQEEVVLQKGWFRKQHKVLKPKFLGLIPDPGYPKIVSKREVKRIRKLTGLTEELGYDSKAFYQDAEPIDVLIMMNSTTLRALARYDREGQ